MKENVRMEERATVVMENVSVSAYFPVIDASTWVSDKFCSYHKNNYQQSPLLIMPLKLVGVIKEEFHS